MGDWNKEYGSNATKRKIYIGRGLKYFEKLGVGKFRLESHSLEVGDKIMITGPTKGYDEAKVSELRLDDQIVDKVNKGDVFTLPITEKSVNRINYTK